MADNIGYTPGYGAQIAADEVNGALVQRVKPAIGVDGQAVDVSSTNPMPVNLTQDLIDVLDNLRASMTSLNRRNNIATTDGAGRQRVFMDTASSLNAINTVSNVANIQNGNLSSFGGVGLFDFMKASSRQGYNTGVRSNVSFS